MMTRIRRSHREESCNGHAVERACNRRRSRAARGTGHLTRSGCFAVCRRERLLDSVLSAIRGHFLGGAAGSSTTWLTQSLLESSSVGGVASLRSRAAWVLIAVRCSSVIVLAHARASLIALIANTQCLVSSVQPSVVQRTETISWTAAGVTPLRGVLARTVAATWSATCLQSSMLEVAGGGASGAGVLLPPHAMTVMNRTLSRIAAILPGGPDGTCGPRFDFR